MRSCVAPCSADFMAKLLHGRADELLSLMCLARPIDQVPLLLAPAMNREMWAHPATQRNMAQLAADGAHILGVGTGFQACGETGDGRMLEPPRAAGRHRRLLPAQAAGRASACWSRPGRPSRRSTRSAASPTIPPARWASPSRARRARPAPRSRWSPARCSLPTPRGVTPHRREVGARHAGRHRRPRRRRPTCSSPPRRWPTGGPASAQRPEDQEGRQRQGAGARLHREPGHPADRGAGRSAPAAARCSASASPPRATTWSTHAKAKRERKGIPLLVGNIGPLTFGQDDNQLLLVDAQGVRELPRAPKLELARAAGGRDRAPPAPDLTLRPNP